jgi:Rod binding domain-containing protein
MSNSLTNLDPSYLAQDMNTMNNIQSKINAEKDEGKGKSFKELFREKLNPDGSVNQKKLDAKEKKLYGSCLDMESLLWKQVLNEMKKTINQYRLTEESQAENVFSDFLYDEYAGMMAKNSKTNISDEMFKQLSGYK